MPIDPVIVIGSAKIASQIFDVVAYAAPRVWADRDERAVLVRRRPTAALA